MSDCLQCSVYADIGAEQTDQLSAMSSELDALRLTCIDRMQFSGTDLSPSQHAVRANTSLRIH